MTNFAARVIKHFYADSINASISKDEHLHTKTPQRTDARGKPVSGRIYTPTFDASRIDETVDRIYTKNKWSGFLAKAKKEAIKSTLKDRLTVIKATAYGSAKIATLNHQDSPLSKLLDSNLTSMELRNALATDFPEYSEAEIEFMVINRKNPFNFDYNTFHRNAENSFQLSQAALSATANNENLTLLRLTSDESIEKITSYLLHPSEKELGKLNADEKQLVILLFTNESLRSKIKSEKTNVQELVKFTRIVDLLEMTHNEGIGKNLWVLKLLGSVVQEKINSPAGGAILVKWINFVTNSDDYKDGFENEKGRHLSYEFNYNNNSIETNADQENSNTEVTHQAIIHQLKRISNNDDQLNSLLKTVLSQSISKAMELGISEILDAFLPKDHSMVIDFRPEKKSITRNNDLSVTFTHNGVMSVKNYGAHNIHSDDSNYHFSAKMTKASGEWKIEDVKLELPTQNAKSAIVAPGQPKSQEMKK
jgi:hypothetical protein